MRCSQCACCRNKWGKSWMRGRIEEGGGREVAHLAVAEKGNGDTYLLGRQSCTGDDVSVQYQIVELSV